MGKHNEPKELRTVEELERFLADFEDEPTLCVFDDVEFLVDRKSAGDPTSHTHHLFPSLWESLRGPAPVFATLALPQPVASDLILRTQARPPEKEESLEACFHIEASDPEALKTYLAGGLGDVILRLNRRFLIEMFDDKILLGSLDEAKGSARALAELIAALPRPSGEDVELPDFDEAVERDGGTVEVAVLEGGISGEMARGALEASGIPCRLEGASGGGPFPSAGMGSEVRVVVPKSFEKQAAAVMEEFEASAPAEEEEDEEK
jgi:hypothetical protein